MMTGYINYVITINKPIFSRQLFLLGAKRLRSLAIPQGTFVPIQLFYSGYTQVPKHIQLFYSGYTYVPKPIHHIRNLSYSGYSLVYLNHLYNIFLCRVHSTTIQPIRIIVFYSVDLTLLACEKQTNYYYHDFYNCCLNHKYYYFITSRVLGEVYDCTLIYTVYSVHCTLYNAYCKLYIVQCKIYNDII